MGHGRIQAGIFIALILFLTSENLRAETPVSIRWQTDILKAKVESEAEKRPLLLYVYSDGCAYCKKMLRDTYSDQSIISEVEQHFVPATVNYSDHPDWVRQLKVRSFPTTVLISSDWEMVDSVEGYMAPNRFRQWLERSTAKLEGNTVKR